MKNSIKAISLLIVMVMIMGLAACSKTPNDTSKETTKKENISKTEEEKRENPIKLKVMLLSEDENRIKIYEEYYEPNVKKELPEFEVEFELPGSAYADKLKIYNASGELPDVFWGQSTIPADSGNCLDLTPYITADGFLDSYQNRGAVMPYKDGNIYSISSGTDSYFTAAVYYHKDIFAEVGVEVPKNYNEFVEVCKALKEKDYIPMSIVPWAVQNWLFQDLVTNVDPQDMIDLKTGKANIMDKPFQDAMNKIKELADLGAFPKDVAILEHQPHVDLFNQNKAAMIYHPLWVLGGIQDNADLDYFYLPSFSKKADTINVWGSPTNGFCVSNNTEYKEEAVKLAEWLTMQDAKFFTEVAKNAVALKGYDAPADMHPIAKNFFDQINDSSVNKENNYTWNYFNEATMSQYVTDIGKLLTGQMDSEKILENIDSTYSN